VRATVVDAHGVLVPGASDLITFKITGPGVVAAVDNGDNASHEPFQAAERHAFQGQVVAFIKATAPSGKIVLTATAPGLKTGRTTLKAVPPVFAP
jgi:beta-galactosidase